MAINENKWDEMVYHCTFDYMKQHAEYASPLARALRIRLTVTWLNELFLY